MENFLGINKWHIRLTFKSELQTVEKFISGLGRKYIICDELTHYHVYMETQLTKKKITMEIKEKLKLSGNEQLSVKEVRKANQMKKYILKDGQYVYNGFADSEIETLRKCSNKKGTDKFSMELVKIEEKYLGDDKNPFRTFVKDFIKLKISYGQNIYGNHIKAYCLKMKFKKDPAFIDEFINELF